MAEKICDVLIDSVGSDSFTVWATYDLFDTLLNKRYEWLERSHWEYTNRCDIKIDHRFKIGSCISDIVDLCIGLGLVIKVAGIS